MLIIYTEIQRVYTEGEKEQVQIAFVMLMTAHSID